MNNYKQKPTHNQRVGSTRGEPSVGDTATIVADQAAQEVERILCHLKFGPYIIDQRMSGHPDILRAKAALLALMYQETLDLIGDDLGEGDDETFAYYFNMCKAEQRQSVAKRYGQIRGEE